MTCDKCKHSVQVGLHKEGNRIIAECRRYPPTAQVILGPEGKPSRITFFPEVNSTLTCGEFTLAILGA